MASYMVPLHDDGIQHIFSVPYLRLRVLLESRISVLLNLMFVHSQDQDSLLTKRRNDNHSPCEKPVRDSTELQDLYTYGILAVVTGI